TPERSVRASTEPPWRPTPGRAAALASAAAPLPTARGGAGVWRRPDALAPPAAPLPTARGGAGLWRRPDALAPTPDGLAGLGSGRRRRLTVVLVGRRGGAGRG